MQDFFKYLIILILFIIVFLILFFIYSNIRNNKIYHKNNKLQKWQKDRLLILIEDRIKRINNTNKTICEDEKNILNILLDKIKILNYWDELDNIINDTRVYYILNIVIMDHLYLSEINNNENKNKFLQNLFLLDCVNGGVKFEGKKPLFFPDNIDIKDTLVLIISNQNELTTTQSEILTSFIANAWKEKDPESFNSFKEEYISNNFKQIVADSAIDKTLSELLNKKHVNNLSEPARKVICKIIIEVLSNVIYSSNNYDKLSENAKIYTRILSMIVANEPYERIYDKFNISKERRK